MTAAVGLPRLWTTRRVDYRTLGQPSRLPTSPTTSRAVAISCACLRHDTGARAKIPAFFQEKIGIGVLRLRYHCAYVGAAANHE
jgi:hypothetical protein